jgi:hypothetical protein
MSMDELTRKAKELLREHTGDDKPYPEDVRAVVAGMRWALEGAWDSWHRSIVTDATWPELMARRGLLRFAAQEEQPGAGSPPERKDTDASSGDARTAPSSPPVVYRVRRNDNGNAVAIERLTDVGVWWTILHLIEGSQRNELNAESMCELLNRGDEAQEAREDAAISAMNRPSAPPVGYSTRGDDGTPRVVVTSALPAASAQSVHSCTTGGSVGEPDEFERFAQDVLAGGDTTSAAYVAQCARARFGRLAEERNRYHDALISRHGGEPVVLLRLLDEARSERDAIQRELDRAYKCDTCVGDPISPHPCICGGTGRSADEKIGLRKEVYRLERELAGLVEERDEACAARDMAMVDLSACRIALDMSESNRARAASDAYADAARHVWSEYLFTERLANNARAQPKRNEAAIMAYACAALWLSRAHTKLTALAQRDASSKSLDGEGAGS